MTRITIALLGLGFCLGASAAPAPGAYGFTASPARLFFETKPGTSNSEEIAVMNQSNGPVRIEAYAWDLWQDKKQKISYGPPGTFPHSAAPWITLAPATQILGPGERGSYKVNINTPTGASGGHYAVVFAEVKPLKTAQSLQDTKTVQFGLRLGTVVYQTTVGSSVEAVEFRKPKVTPPSASAPFEVSTRLVNSGDTFLQPKVSVRVIDPARRTIAKMNLEIADNEPETLLPGQVRVFSAKYAGDLKPGKYTALVSCQYGKQGIKTIQVGFEVTS